MNGLFPGGGTELTAAIKAFLGSRQTSMPTAAFILTDGEVYKVGGLAIDGPVSECSRSG